MFPSLNYVIQYADIIDHAQPLTTPGEEPFIDNPRTAVVDPPDLSDVRSLCSRTHLRAYLKYRRTQRILGVRDVPVSYRRFSKLRHIHGDATYSSAADTRHATCDRTISHHTAVAPRLRSGPFDPARVHRYKRDGHHERKTAKRRTDHLSSLAWIYMQIVRGRSIS